MPDALPFRLDRLTLRVCYDLDWRVSVGCEGCRHTTQLRADRWIDQPMAGEPLPTLLERCVFRCRRRCAGRPADRLAVSYSHVGVERNLAVWTVETLNGWRAARLAPQGPG